MDHTTIYRWRHQVQAGAIDALAGQRQAPDATAEARIRELERALGRKTLGARSWGSVAAVGLRERSRIGRVLTAEDHPQRYPKQTVAGVLGISRQALYHRPPVEAGVVVRGPWPDAGPR